MASWYEGHISVALVNMCVAIASYLLPAHITAAASIPLCYDTHVIAIRFLYMGINACSHQNVMFAAQPDVAPAQSSDTLMSSGMSRVSHS